VSAIESTPVSGVEIRNEVTAGRLAPLRRSSAAAGSTPHEHSGIGAPNSAASSTDRGLRLPRWRAIKPPGRNSWSSPATKKPIRM
jgi:hypothetical protein